MIHAPRLDGPRAGPLSGRAPRLLVVLCHGVGADGSQLFRHVPALAAAVPDAAFVAPDAPFAAAPRRARWNPFMRTSRHIRQPRQFQWYSLADRAAAAQEAGVRAASAILSPFVDAELARLALAPDAYVLIGFSQGAMLALFAGLRRATAPRAIIAYAGALIAPDHLAGELRNHAPVLLVHGATDTVVPSWRSRDAALALAACEVPVVTRYLSDSGHAIEEPGVAASVAFLRERSVAT